MRRGKPATAAASRQWCTGEIHKVPCPWCGRTNDFRESREIIMDQWSGQGSGDKPWFRCDHCGRGVEVVKAARTILVSVRKTNKGDTLNQR